MLVATHLERDEEEGHEAGDDADGRGEGGDGEGEGGLEEEEEEDHRPGVEDDARVRRQTDCARERSFCPGDRRHTQRVPQQHIDRAAAEGERQVGEEEGAAERRLAVHARRPLARTPQIAQGERLENGRPEEDGRDEEDQEDGAAPSSAGPPSTRTHKVLFRNETTDASAWKKVTPMRSETRTVV